MYQIRSIKEQMKESQGKKHGLLPSGLFKAHFGTVQKETNHFISTARNTTKLRISAPTHQPEPLLHMMNVVLCNFCLPNTLHNRNAPPALHCSTLKVHIQHDITLMPVIGVSALRVIHGLPRPIIWCLSIYYSTLEEKLTRGLLNVVCAFLCWCCCMRDGWSPLFRSLLVKKGEKNYI